MRKKHDPPKNIRTKDNKENFRYFLFEVDRGATTDIYIHKETQTIFDKIDFIQDQYTQLVVTEISPLGQWEYNALKQAGTLLFKDFCRN